MESNYELLSCLVVEFSPWDWWVVGLALARSKQRLEKWYLLPSCMAQSSQF